MNKAKQVNVETYYRVPALSVTMRVHACHWPLHAHVKVANSSRNDKLYIRSLVVVVFDGGCGC